MKFKTKIEKIHQRTLFFSPIQNAIHQLSPIGRPIANLEKPIPIRLASRNDMKRIEKNEEDIEEERR